MNIVFRVDASIQMGTGHVMRCLTLAEELRRLGHSCVFICREHPGNLREFIIDKSFVVHLLSTTSGVNFTVENDDTAHAEWLGVSWRIDAEQTLAALGSMEVDWLVVDHYALDARWEKLLAKAAGQIMVVDDLADRHHACNLLLDQNLGREIADYDHKVPEHCTRLIGPKYALLRPEFAELRERSLKRRENPELKRILISLGGVDRTNVTGKILEALEETRLPKETQIDVIMGAAAPYLNEVRQKAAKLPFKSKVSVNVSDIGERMCMADLAIGAAGSTSWERCCLGLPAILVVLADNQKMVNQSLIEKGVAVGLDVEILKEVGGTLLDHVLAQVWPRARELTAKAAVVTDGFGCSRLVGYLMRAE